MKKDIKQIVLISDHAGFKLKEELRRFLELKDFKVKDMGPTNDEKSVNYAPQGIRIGKHIAKHPGELGIAICGTGIGISFAINRVKGIRGARITSIADAKMAKLHNNANILAMGGRTTTTKKAVDMFNAFMREEFEGGRHLKRLEALDK